MRRLIILLLVAGAAMVPRHAQAAIVTAASCNLTDVQTALALTVLNDTLEIPAGTCNWTAAGGFSLTGWVKITVKGAGIGQTIINCTSSCTGSSQLININQSGARVTGMTLNEGQINVNGTGWRVDHVRFTSAGFRIGVNASNTSGAASQVWGLIDHNEFLNCRIVVQGGVLKANPQWFQSWTAGSPDAVYAEDNVMTFTVFSNAMDCNYGGRYVFRHNVVTDSYIEAHSVQGDNRACRSFEIYDNVIQQSGEVVFIPISIRGGTGVIFNNTFSGTFTSLTIGVNNRRVNETFTVSGICDGANAWDGNQDGIGWPCRDQVGRSTDAFLWVGTSPIPTQIGDPMYAWNNTHVVSGNVPVVPNNGSSAWIIAGRDFFDDGSQKPGYTPYTYPFPRIATDDGAVPVRLRFK